MYDNWHVELAKQFKNRDNKEQFGAILGDVISVSPLKIAIYNNQVILTDVHCYVCSSLKSRKVNITLDDVADHGIINTSATINYIFSAGDKVLCLPTPDGQTYFIIDKVVV